MRGPQPWKSNRARVLRSEASTAADRMWQELRSRRLGGHKFVREFPIGPFFVDFVCREAKVIVEIDGATHSTSAEIAYDRTRELYLRSEGFRIFRAHNTEVEESIDGVCDSLLEFIGPEAE